MKRDSALTFLELLVVCCVIFTLMGLFSAYANTYIRVARETALRNELSNLRMSIEYYRIVKGHIPRNLTDLINDRLTSAGADVNITANTFLANFRLSRDGFLLDPFMNRYIYDNATGRVWSESVGRKNW